ncbi:MAG: protein translocase subunit SecD [Chloroflexi bacterium]|nr:protein translocase subunit SecD [Chloroflexota bacterium]
MRLWNWLVLVFILLLTAGSVVTIWPSEPDRYLPNAIPWPEGKGVKFSIPSIRGGTFGLTSIERRAMSLGLDLRGGTRLVFEPEDGVQVEDLDAALEGARKIIERRVNEFGVAESEVTRLGSNRLAVQLPGINPDEAIAKIGRTALLQFCRPIIDVTGNVAILEQGAVVYQSLTCEPVRDADGNIVVEATEDLDGNIVEPGEVEFVPWFDDASPSAGQNPPARLLVWEPASAEVDGRVLTLDGQFLRPDTFVTLSSNPIFGNQPALVFNWRGDGPDISEIVTTLLAAKNYPLSPWLDGEPILSSNNLIIAPHVQTTLTSGGQITGLDFETAQELSTLLNTGAFPIPLKIVQQQDVDATLGDKAVRNSVIAGQIGLLLIMAFMILYYRLPGLMAALALVIYTTFVLAVFKLWPVTLTLAGVAAFILSVGMAVDANILIFERMKEELRVGRNLIVALEDGFSRAWSSIRDSNISTLIICAILYWFGNQFGESAIKGFAITLGIGVVVSMFSAITVTRTLMLLVVSWRPAARRLWLFMPADQEEAAGGVPAIAGGSGER